MTVKIYESNGPTQGLYIGNVFNSLIGISQDQPHVKLLPISDLRSAHIGGIDTILETRERYGAEMSVYLSILDVYSKKYKYSPPVFQDEEFLQQFDLIDLKTIFLDVFISSGGKMDVNMAHLLADLVLSGVINLSEFKRFMWGAEYFYLRKPNATGNSGSRLSEYLTLLESVALISQDHSSKSENDRYRDYDRYYSDELTRVVKDVTKSGFSASIEHIRKLQGFPQEVSDPINYVRTHGVEMTLGRAFPQMGRISPRDYFTINRFLSKSMSRAIKLVEIMNHFVPINPYLNTLLRAGLITPEEYFDRANKDFEDAIK